MKSLVKITRIMYPKARDYVNAGEFAILCAELIEHIEGEKPIIDKFWNNIKLKGTVPELALGDEIIIAYDNGETNQYGTTYEIKSVSLEIDENDPVQVKSYLTTICGNQIASELMKIDNPIKLLKEKNTEELIKIKYITEKALDRIYKKIDDFGDFAIAISELEPLGLTRGLIMNLCKVYKSSKTVIEKCKTNPYEFIDKVRGISFIKADEIAQKCALDMTSDIRLKYLILYILEYSAKDGKTFLYSHQLLQEIDQVMKVTFDKINKVLEELYNENKIMLLNQNTEICLNSYFNLEKEICKELIRLNNAKSEIDIPDNWEEIVKKIEQEQGWEYTDEQFEGIKTVLFNNVSIITGKAGTGKSTITNAICEILDDYFIDLTCLSAKAAQRIGEVTGRYSQTIHRLLQLTPTEEFPDTRDGLIYTDILIIDEASMVNGTLFLLILRALKDGSKLIIVGDDGQLQPIGNCSVFSDLLESKRVPVVQLTKIHRQAAKSAIITKSIDIRNQKHIYPSGFFGHDVLGELKDLEIYIHKKDEEATKLINEILECFSKQMKRTKNILETQIIVPTKTKGELSMFNINNEIQKIYNINALKDKNFYETKQGSKIFIGDKVINTKNNYHTKTTEGMTIPIYNGNIGIVKEITKSSIIINFNNLDIEFKNSDRNSIELAYAITIHSAQGSQWESVITAINMSSYNMLTAELLYTAITRSISHCDLIAIDDAIRKSIRTIEQRFKQTYLPRFLESAKIS